MRALRFILCTLRFVLFTLRIALLTLHITKCALQCMHFALCFGMYNLYFTMQTFYIIIIMLTTCTLQFEKYTSRFGHYNVCIAICDVALLYTLQIKHCALYITHCALQSTTCALQGVCVKNILCRALHILLCKVRIAMRALCFGHYNVHLATCAFPEGPALWQVRHCALHIVPRALCIVWHRRRKDTMHTFHIIMCTLNIVKYALRLTHYTLN